MAATFEGSGAEILVETLLHGGVETVFGVPGDTGVALYDALYRRPQLRHVLLNDERGAAFAADAYARCSNRLGVVEVSSGGGVTFAVGGLGEAHAASVPLLVIASDIHGASRGTGALTEIDQVALFQSVTKWQAVATDAAELPALLEEAATRAVSGRPAPVALIVPEDVLDERARVELRPIQLELPPARPLPPSDALARAVAAGRRRHARDRGRGWCPPLRRLRGAASARRTRRRRGRDDAPRQGGLRRRRAHPRHRGRERRPPQREPVRSGRGRCAARRDPRQRDGHRRLREPASLRHGCRPDRRRPGTRRPQLSGRDRVARGRRGHAGGTRRSRPT